VLDRVPRHSHTNRLEGKTMTEQRVLLAETAAKVFRDLPEDGALPGWDRVAESGLCGVMVPEAAGGFGWERWLGTRGTFVGMKGFGASAKAADLYKHFGITAEAIADAARRLRA